MKISEHVKLFYFGMKTSQNDDSFKFFFKSDFDVSTIYARVVVNGRELRTSTGIVCPTSWFSGGAVQMKSDDSAAARRAIAQAVEQHSERVREAAAQCDDSSTPNDLKALMREKKKIGRTVADVLHTYADSMKNRSINTRRHVARTVELWRQFTKAERADYTVEELSDGVVSRFVEYISCGGVRSTNTVSSYMTAFRSAMRRHLPDIRIKKPTERYDDVEPVYLTPEELRSVSKHRCSDSRVERYRELFVLQCRTGLRVSDLTNLNEANITERDGQQYLVTISQKTAITAHLPMSGDMGEQIRRLIIENKSFRLATYNEAIKSVLRECGITRSVVVRDGDRQMVKQLCEVGSSHMARRTFIGTLYAQNIDRAVITSMSGHRRDSKALNRYFTVADSQQRTAVGILDAILKESK